MPFRRPLIAVPTLLLMLSLAGCADDGVVCRQLRQQRETEGALQLLGLVHVVARSRKPRFLRQPLAFRSDDAVDRLDAGDATAGHGGRLVREQSKH